MQSTNQPAKFLVPFAQNDSARVEIPATSADPTRFSQSAGSPPLTGMPPEAGGVPPQLEDFNGALNQIARGVWWALGGGRFGYDATWAMDPLIAGYARGAVLPAAIGAGIIGMGEWYNNTEGNTADPDVAGTGWVPGYHYGGTALAGQTGGTVTLTPAQAAKRVISVAGTLTSNLVLVVPGWVYDWTIYNNTGGAFTVTVKNAATPAVEIPQNGAPTPVRCDGSAVTLWSPNIAPAVQSTQAMQLGQATGRLLGVQRITASGTYTPTAGTTRIIVEIVGAGGGGAAATATGTATNSSGGGGGSGAYVKALINSVPASVAVTIGAGGAGGDGVTDPSSNGSVGGTTTFGAYATASGGAGGLAGTQSGQTSTSNFASAGGAGGSTATVGGGAVGLVLSQGRPGVAGTSLSGGATIRGGDGAASALGGNAHTGNSQVLATAPPNSGAGGSGTSNPAGYVAIPGGTGGSGICLVWEYA